MGRGYVVVATCLFSSLQLFLLLGAIFQPLTRPPAGNPIVERYGEIVYQAYPGWNRDDVNTLLHEAWRRPNNFDYDAFCQFKESADLQQGVERNLYVDRVHYQSELCEMVAGRIVPFCEDRIAAMAAADFDNAAAHDTVTTH